MTAIQNKQPTVYVTCLKTPDVERLKNAKAQDIVESAVRTHASQVRSLAKWAFIRSNLSSSPRNEWVEV
jgi:hypothetical protein